MFTGDWSVERAIVHKEKKEKENELRKEKLFSFVLLAILISSAAIATVSAIPYAENPPTLLDNTTLKIAGSSTILPVANLEAAQFPTYWNSLVTAHSSWGAHQITSALVPAGGGSGAAISSLYNGVADIGEMSRPPTDAEWNNANMTNMQIWAIGIDSVAIVLSPDMGWFPENLTTLQVAKLFANTPESSYTTPYYNTYGDFLTDYYNGTVPATINGWQINSTVTNMPVHRAVRDLTSGTADCWNIYFGTANGFDFLTESKHQLATYTPCQENINIYNVVSAGNLEAGTDYVGFIALGYLQTYGNMLGLNIAFNMHNAPLSCITNDEVKVWGSAVEPTRANVIYGYSGVKGAAATGQYMAWRWLWEVTPRTIPSTGEYLEVGVWIAYMKLEGSTQDGASTFVNDAAYIDLCRADLTGGQVLNSTLQPHTTLSTQTQTIPDGKATFDDFIFFLDGYIRYYSAATYSPYSDINANGVIDFDDFIGFLNAYIGYYQTYNPI